jgi:hypothetical protein
MATMTTMTTSEAAAMRRPDRRHRIGDARANIGRTIRWHDDDCRGVITDVVIERGGWPVYVVDWAPGYPDWWAHRVATEHPAMVIE